MTFGELRLDGNVLELALIAAVLTLLAAVFVLGRLDWLKRGMAEQRSIDALRKVRTEEEARNDELRKKTEGILRAADRAAATLERWEIVKNEHERLQEMRRELDAFESEESRRIDELERRRAEATRRLGEIQMALDPYPPEITGDDSAWNERLDGRRKDIDELRKKMQGAEKEYSEADACRTQAADEAAKLERKRSQFDAEIEAARWHDVSRYAESSTRAGNGSNA